MPSDAELPAASRRSMDPRLSSAHQLLQRPRVFVRVDRQMLEAVPELVSALLAFEPLDHPAGAAVAAWLRETAVTDPQESTVHLRLAHGRVTGVYALCATSILLTRRERADLGDVRFRTQPGFLVAQLARAADAPGVGDELLRHATATARRALRYVAATVLVVDPVDGETAQMWRTRFGFRESQQPTAHDAELRRLWLPLQADYLPRK